MRTTLTLDDDLARRLRRLAGKRGDTFRAVVDDALRRGLDALERRRERQPYHLEGVSLRPRPGLDLDKLGQ